MSVYSSVPCIDVLVSCAVLVYQLPMVLLFIYVQNRVVVVEVCFQSNTIFVSNVVDD